KSWMVDRPGTGISSTTGREGRRVAPSAEAVVGVVVTLSLPPWSTSVPRRHCADAGCAGTVPPARRSHVKSPPQSDPAHGAGPPATAAGHAGWRHPTPPAARRGSRRAANTPKVRPAPHGASDHH